MGCQLTIRALKVRSLTVEHNEVSWELEPTLADVLDYTFQVLRSEGSEGPYDTISAEFDDRYLFLDDSIKSLHRYRQLHYQVRVRNKVTGEFEDFGPAEIGHDDDLVTKEVRSHITLLMREFIGERCWLLPVRTFGQRCSSCWSESLKKRTRSGCRTCWETSFVRGYMHPIEAWVSIDPSANAEQMSSQGKLQQNDTTARLTYYPPCKVGDLLVCGARRTRYKVTQVNETAHVGSSVHQEIQLHQIPESALENSIPIQLDEALRNIFLKPERNFTNPQQLEALGSEVPDGIFSLYQVRS
jgi:hypothetical protein